MERSTLSQRLSGLWQKLSRYRYALLVLLLGVGLMLLPGRQEAAAPTVQPDSVAEPPAEELCRRLEQTLSRIDGAGTVHCLLTWREGVRTVYQTDTSQSASGEVKNSTVLVSTGSGTESAVAAGTVGPVWQGVVVVCEGADSAQLRLEITRAVGALTGLSSDKIAVVKGKGRS